MTLSPTSARTVRFDSCPGTNVPGSKDGLMRQVEGDRGEVTMLEMQSTEGRGADAWCNIPQTFQHGLRSDDGLHQPATMPMVNMHEGTGCFWTL